MGDFKQTGYVTYIKINNDGDFVISSKTKKEDYVEKQNRRGETIYEFHFNELANVILKNITIIENDYGITYNIYLENESNKTDVLQLNASSPYTNTFLLKLNAIEDYSEELTIKVGKYYNKEKGQDFIFLSPSVGNNKVVIDDAILKALPRTKVTTDEDGKKIYDKTETLNYIADIINNSILTRLN